MKTGVVAAAVVEAPRKIRTERAAVRQQRGGNNFIAIAERALNGSVRCEKDLSFCPALDSRAKRNGVKRSGFAHPFQVRQQGLERRLKVLNNLADIKSAGGVALRVRTQPDYQARMDTLRSRGASDGP